MTDSPKEATDDVSVIVNPAELDSLADGLVPDSLVCRMRSIRCERDAAELMARREYPLLDPLRWTTALQRSLSRGHEHNPRSIYKNRVGEAWLVTDGRGASPEDQRAYDVRARVTEILRYSHRLAAILNVDGGQS